LFNSLLDEYLGLLGGINKQTWQPIERIDPMSKTNAFWRLFPASLFTILSVVWCYAWRFDPVLTGVAVCIGGVSISWLVITVVEVAKTLTIAPSSLPGRSAPAPTLAS